MKFRIFCAICMMGLAFTTQITLARNANNLTKTEIQNFQDDAIITKSIKEKIAGSKVLGKLSVNISTSRGVVTMIGNVDSDAQASMLIELANSIIGVTDVNASELRVKKSTQPFTDMVTTAKIKGLFVKEKFFGEKDIAVINLSVETTNGVVYLTGDIDNNDQIRNAISIIKKNVPEVKHIEYKVRKLAPANQNTK